MLKHERGRGNRCRSGRARAAGSHSRRGEPMPSIAREPASSAPIGGRRSLKTKPRRPRPRQARRGFCGRWRRHPSPSDGAARRRCATRLRACRRRPSSRRQTDQPRRDGAAAELSARFDITGVGEGLPIFFAVRETALAPLRRRACVARCPQLIKLQAATRPTLKLLRCCRVCAAPCLTPLCARLTPRLTPL
jgi:hypothetical protein